ncbi:VOC family protein [Virgibacillus siamensis]|uniref:VOC family protein n=1 Tax=Virgibacillus siamensis TaxID=480071 RepID=UPI0009FC4F6F|nr:VOC family protein [Virgibacillus siamensis]
MIPIKNKMNTVFVHVSDLKNSVRWYSRLLNEQVDLSEVKEPVHNMTLNQYTGLTLDAGPTGEKKEIVPSEYPLFNFHTEDIEKAYVFVKELGYPIESEIIRFDDFSYFNVSDPDGNIIMICTG